MSEDDPEPLRTENAVLAAENERLREAYAAATHSQYRRTAIGLAAVGGLAAVAATVFPAARPVLFSLAAIGGFGAVLTYYLTPERFVAASVADRIQRATADSYATIADELGLTDTRVYVPHDDAAVLFVPAHRDYDLPDEDALEHRFVATDDARRGLTLAPAGAPLLAAAEPALAGPLQDEPAALATQLGDAVVEQFELADSVTTDATADQVTYAVTAPALGDLADVDHPVTSFLAVGTATGLDTPVTVDVTVDEETPLVTCRWD